MTKQEFIIQYVLQHKEMPLPLLLEEMEENKCFDTPEVVKEEKIVEDSEIIKYDPDKDEYTNLKVGTKVIFTNQFRPLNCSVTFPKGYVGIVDYVRSNHNGFIEISTTCITNGKKTSKRKFKMRNAGEVISNLAITQNEPSHIEDTLIKGNEYTTCKGQKSHSSIHNYKVVI